MPESSVWIYSLQSVLTPVTIWATCFAHFFFLNQAPYYLSLGTDGIFNHLPLQRKIYVSCLEPSFDFKEWWIEMSSLHHIYLVVIHNIVRSCTGCLAIDYFQSQRHLLTEKIYHSIRLWAHDFFVSASDL
jgi:hypothetical protein